MSDYPVFTIDKDEDAPMRAFHLAKDLYERIIEAENLAFMNAIKANIVVINGRKYGMLKDKPGVTPTIFGMRAETKVDMPDAWDFFLQERPPQPKTNAARIRAMTDEELAKWMYEHMACRYCPCMPCVSSDDIDEEGNIKCTPCEQILLEWLRKEAEQ